MSKTCFCTNINAKSNLFFSLIIWTMIGLAGALILGLKSRAMAQLPNGLNFCQEKVPLNRPEVHESIDQELLLLSEAKSRVWTTLRRSERHLPTIEQALQSKKVPLDFKYLPMAIANLDPDYRSGNRRGLWRMTETEAAAMGLLVNKEVDERLDPVASSAAAAAKIASLKRSLGNWTMALAAFLDPISLATAVSEAGQSSDYFALFVSENLDKTLSLVLAAKVLYSAPEAYGYRPSQFWPTLANGRRRVDTAQNLREVAKSFSLDYRTFRDMNPHILGDIAPAGSYLNTP